jgi:hypothetical protein
MTTVRFISHLRHHRPKREDGWGDHGKKYGDLSGSNLFSHASPNVLSTLVGVLERATEHEEEIGDKESGDLEGGSRGRQPEGDGRENLLVSDEKHATTQVLYSPNSLDQAAGNRQMK